jgi:hypothetical protein
MAEVPDPRLEQSYVGVGLSKWWSQWKKISRGQGRSWLGIFSSSS